MSTNEETIIKSRFSPTKSIASAVTTLIICAGLFFYLSQFLGGGKIINSVKNGHPNIYPNITFEQAFGKYYSDPKWSYYKSTTGNDVVTFTGKCKYEGKQTTVELRYVINEDNTFQLAGGTVNGVEQNLLVLAQFSANPFSEY